MVFVFFMRVHSSRAHTAGLHFLYLVLSCAVVLFFRCLMIGVHGTRF